MKGTRAKVGHMVDGVPITQLSAGEKPPRLPPGTKIIKMDDDNANWLHNSWKGSRWRWVNRTKEEAASHFEDLGEILAHLFGGPAVRGIAFVEKRGKLNSRQPGVYVVWFDGQVIYVGMSGGEKHGLRERLQSYVPIRRGSDSNAQFRKHLKTYLGLRGDRLTEWMLTNLEWRFEAAKSADDAGMAEAFLIRALRHDWMMNKYGAKHSKAEWRKWLLERSRSTVKGK
ncbi:MAG: hypothetical protein WC876_10855 [Candidatus Thermoplasmatota archaeon]|jgi:hypothetical protein